MNVVVKNMIPTASRASCVLVAMLSFASLASAQNAFTNRTVKLHAGPDRNYPTVSVIGPGAMVYVNGCLRNFNWCDVQAGPARGWANARNLNYTYGGRPMAIYGNGVRFGFPSSATQWGRTGTIITALSLGTTRTATTGSPIARTSRLARRCISRMRMLSHPRIGRKFTRAQCPCSRASPHSTSSINARVVVRQHVAPHPQSQRQQPQHSQRAHANGHLQHRP